MAEATVGELYDRAVRAGGERVAISQGGVRVTYRELGALAGRLTAGFAALGLGKGDRIAFLMTNCPQYVACEYAVARLGAIRVPLAVQLAEDDHVYMMNFAHCKALVYHEKLAARVESLRARLATVRLFVCASDERTRVPVGDIHLEGLAAEAARDPGMPAGDAEAVAPEDLAAIYFTGGTTGRPKGVMLSHRSWFHTCYAEMLEFPVGRQETMVLSTPVTHAAGCLILPVLLRQGRCVLLERFEGEQLFAAIERERASATLLVPTMLYALLDHVQEARYDLRSLRNVLYGAAPIAPERLKEALRRFGPIFTQFFGQTEAPMALCALAREEHVVADPGREAAVLASAGRPTYPTRLRLIDAAGRCVPAGEPGEIVVQSPNMMSGYLDDPQATAEAIRDGWLHTGDIARLDAEGFVTIVDRRKDLIISGGFNVYPREVEDVLFEHPAVRQAAVLGIPHERWGEAVKALVVLEPGARVSAAELIEFVKARRGSVMAPKSIDFVAAIPLTNLGKVDKKSLRAAYWAGRPRSV